MPRVLPLMLALLTLPPALAHGALTVPAAVAAQPIYVGYPKAGARIAADHVIFEGSVRPGASLSVNGRPVNVGPDGLFIEWLPLTAGVNTLTLLTVLNGQTSNQRFSVTSAPPAAPPTAPARILPGTLTPDGPWVRYGVPGLQPEDRRVMVGFSGSAGGQATFWAGPRGPFAMTEDRPGHYSGGYTLQPGDEMQPPAAVRFLLSLPGGSRAQASAPGSLAARPGPRVAEVVAPDVGRGVNPFLAGWAPAGGLSVMYPRQGVRFRVVGETPGTLLVRLPGGTPALPLLEVTRSTATLLPAGTPLPAARLDTATAQDEGSHLALRLRLGARVPYRLTQDGNSVVLSLFDTMGDTEGLNAAPLSDPLLAGIAWTQDGSTLTAALTLNTAQQWGYDATYDGTALMLRLRRPPPPFPDMASPDPARPLAGRVIVVDPGHGGSETGGAGALRVNEKDIVLDIALRVAAELRQAGAQVVLTRQDDVQVPLYDRDLLAETVDADVLLSIHANALPDGTDPGSRRGSGVYFTQPQARALAESLQQALVHSPLQPGDDGLHPDADLALTRPSTQLSVLVETAYLTDAGNLRSLMSEAGRAGYAAAIAQGVLKFYAGATQPATGQP